jgi:hypothetical protein
VNTAISTAAMIPFRTKAVKKVLVEAVVVVFPVTSDLGSSDKWLLGLRRAGIHLRRLL